MKEKTRGYLGVVGAVLLLVGQFMPYIEVWFVQTSLFDWLAEESLFFCGVAICAAVGTLILSFLNTKFAAVLAAAELIAILILTFTDRDGMRVSDVMECLSFGFWVMALGAVLAILSPFMDGLNKKIGGLFHG